MRFIFPLVIAAVAHAAITPTHPSENANIIAPASVGKLQDNDRSQEESSSGSQWTEGLSKRAEAGRSHDVQSSHSNAGTPQGNEAPVVDVWSWEQLQASKNARKARGRAMLGSVAVQPTHRPHTPSPDLLNSHRPRERVYAGILTPEQKTRFTREGNENDRKREQQQRESLGREQAAGKGGNAQTSREQEESLRAAPKVDGSQPQKRALAASPRRSPLPDNGGLGIISDEQVQRGKEFVKTMRKNWNAETRTYEEALKNQQAAQYGAECERQAARQAKKGRLGRFFRNCVGKPKKSRPRTQFFNPMGSG